MAGIELTVRSVGSAMLVAPDNAPPPGVYVIVPFMLNVNVALAVPAIALAVENARITTVDSSEFLRMVFIFLLELVLSCCALWY